MNCFCGNSYNKLGFAADQKKCVPCKLPKYNCGFVNAKEQFLSVYYIGKCNPKCKTCNGQDLNDCKKCLFQRVTVGQNFCACKPGFIENGHMCIQPKISPRLTELTGKISLNLSRKELEGLGFTAIYDKTYGTVLRTEEIQNIIKTLQPDDLIVVGGYAVANRDLLLVAAIDSAKFALKVTASGQVAIPGSKPGLFWYCVLNQSVGFAEIQTISLSSADTFN